MGGLASGARERRPGVATGRTKRMVVQVEGLRLRVG